METPFGSTDKSIVLGFEASKNESNYEALLRRLVVSQLLGARKIQVYSELQTYRMSGPASI